MATRIKLRRDTSTRWENINPILSLGEPGLETDTGKIKYGDGISTWNTLDYFAGEGGGATDRLSDSGDEVILVGGANPYVTFPAITGGDQLQIQGAEVSSVSGSLAFTSQDNLIIIANGSGDEPGGSKSWTFGANGELTLPAGGSIVDTGDSGNSLIILGTGATIAENQRAARVALNGDVEGVAIGAGTSDWTFTNDGDLTLPAGGDIKDSDGNSVLGGGNQLVSNEDNNTFSITNSGDVVLSGEIPGGVNRGLVWDYGANINGGVNSMIRQDEGGLSVRAWSEGAPEPFSASVNIVTNQDANERIWEFDGEGNLTLPVGGDILDSDGNSVLGGTISVGNGVGPSVEQVSEILFNGTITEIGPNVVGVSIDPSIPNTIKGFINLVGDRPNDYDDAWFEAVTVGGPYAYAAGADWYIANNNNLTKVYKFNLETGNQVWVKKIVSGRDAQFTIDIAAGVPSVTSIDAAGVDYKVGEEIPIRGSQIGGSDPLNDIILIVDTINGTGGITSVSIKPGYNLTGITSNNVAIGHLDNARGDVNCIAHLPATNKLVVVREHGSNRGNAFDSYWQWSDIHVLDAETGEVESTKTLQEEGDVYANSIRVAPNGSDYAVVGEKYNEYREFGALTMAVKANGYFDILKSNLDPEHYPGAPFNNSSDFWITGTGISSMENVDQVNYYPNLPTTTREGSGAEFQIVSTGGGDPYVSALALVGFKGTNYVVGHKIKILGTALGGATPANDAIVTVTTVGTGGSIEAATISGTAGDTPGVGGTYTNVTGTNYQVGSGALISIYVDIETGAFSYGGYNNGGSNYVVGDVLTIAGTNFAGGTSPANNATLVVNSVSGSGEIQSIVNGEVSGNAPSNILRINVDGVDFTAVGGSWSMKQNLGGEAFVWTPTWSNAIGGPSGDRFYDVCWKDDGSALYAVGRGVYETNYDQALVVKFNATTGAVIWSKDIKFSEASNSNRDARAVVVIPGSTDIMVAGTWYNPALSRTEIIMTRITDAGVSVWQKTYAFENNYWFNQELNLRATDNAIVLSLQQNTNNNGGWGCIQIDADDGTVIRHRVLSSDGNSNYTYYDTPTANFADVYSNGGKDYQVMAGYTYVPTDNYYNALLVKMPLDGYKDMAFEERVSLGEHILTRHDISSATVTAAFDAFTPDEHVNTFTVADDLKDYKIDDPSGYLKVWTYNITDDDAGYLEFGDGSKQSFATDKIPQIPAANDYYLTTQDSGKHIFFEHENGWVYILDRESRYYPVGFTFTVVNTTGSDCFVETIAGVTPRARLKLAGRNIDTYTIGIPDSGSGSMVTFLKIKDGYTIENSDGLGVYPDVWIVSGPSDVYDND